MELKEMIKVMQHYDNGGDVVYRSKDDTFGASQNKKDGNLSWNWEFMDYRIKEQKPKVTIEKWLLKHIDSGEHFIMESSDVDLTFKYSPKWRKLKLIETYEVEL